MNIVDMLYSDGAKLKAEVEKRMKLGLTQDAAIDSILDDALDQTVEEVGNSVVHGEAQEVPPK